MSDKQKELNELRVRIDEIDEQILDLLSERNDVIQKVVQTKVKNQLPVFVPSREEAKTESFKGLADSKGIDPVWAEDFLRMIMSASRASQSETKFPRSTEEPKHILFIGGEGGMGKLY